ncbi:class I SAM-dependent methyltransferase [Apibacter sp. HY039]|uniref:class I SAM-dependent methyltransferase n=1 Tax=Apibacter sp. HY039 TaxID=2501476 RepID=UPI000FEB9B92|nr:class I SAM-dependent methyltransferase [Apibacter sp. HY039]
MKVKDHFLTKEIFEINKSDKYKGVLQTKNIPDNLDKYYDSDDYLSHSKKNNLKSKIYQFIQKLNENYKLKIISKYKSEGKILDYGCGDGSFLNFIKKNNFRVEGYEPNIKAKLNAEVKIGKQHIFDNIDSINSNSYDIITLWHVLEHIPNPEEIILKLKSKLNKEGILIIAVPNFESYDAKFYKENWAAWDVPRHLFHYGKKGAINFFTQNGLNVLHTYPLPFDSFYISLISENYAHNPLGILRFPFIGTISNLKGMKDGNYSSVIYILNN